MRWPSLPAYYDPSTSPRVTGITSYYDDKLVVGYQKSELCIMYYASSSKSESESDLK
jgi:hypothetical protein